MTKATIQRQKLIADFIDTGKVSSQNQLKGVLKKNGIIITQATLSRDLFLSLITLTRTSLVLILPSQSLHLAKIDVLVL